MIPAPSQQTGEPHHRYPVSQQQTASLVGRPIHFTEGQFAGKTIRAKLQELQAAAFGRKYAITPGEIFTVKDLCPASDMLKWIAVRWTHHQVCRLLNLVRLDLIQYYCQWPGCGYSRCLTP
jgi:hypothetical protein